MNNTTIEKLQLNEGQNKRILCKFTWKRFNR